MKREELAKRLARESGISTAAAADQLDGILSGILRQVRQGHSASLPGLGTFMPGAKAEFYFEQYLPPGARHTKSPRDQRAKGSADQRTKSQSDQRNKRKQESR